MKASVLYRVAAVLLVLFAVGHTVAFWQSDPSWHAESVIDPMRSVRFEVGGFRRTYWELFLGAGFSLGILYLFAAVVAWQLGGLPAETLARMRCTAWVFAMSFAAVTVVSAVYLFWVPIGFAGVITVCLGVAAARGRGDSATAAQ